MFINWHLCVTCIVALTVLDHIQVYYNSRLACNLLPMIGTREKEDFDSKDLICIVDTTKLLKLYVSTFSIG